MEKCKRQTTGQAWLEMSAYCRQKTKINKYTKNYANYDKVWEPIPVITVNERQNITFNCKDKVEIDNCRQNTSIDLSNKKQIAGQDILSLSLWNL